MNTRIKTAAVPAALTLTAVLLTVFSKPLSEDMRSAVMRCTNVIVPSLFAFMAVADLLVRSGAYIAVSRLISPLTKLIGLPADAGAVFVISNCAGYPVGASMICGMLDSGALDRMSASRLMCTCFGAGPAFFSSAVGIAVFGSARVGMMLFVSVVCANVMVSAVLFRVFPVSVGRTESEQRFSAEMLPVSVTSAGRGLFGICSMILFFQAVMTLISPLTALLPVRESTRQSLMSFLEISALSSVKGTPFRLLPLMAAAGAFGGVCVMMQVFVIVGGRFSLKPFAAARILCAGVSAVIMKLLWSLFGTRAVTASAVTVFLVNINNFIPSVCLIIMIFLTILKKGVAFSDRI